MKKSRLCRFATLPLSLLLLLGTACSIPALSLPQSPEGYSWQQIEDLKAAVLLPDGWAFERMVADNLYCYRLTKQKQQSREEVPGQTVLTIVARLNSEGERDEGLAPSRLSTALFEEIAANRVLERSQSAVQGPFDTIRYQYVDASGASAPVREYALLVANDATGTVYIFTFQARLSEWEADWRTIAVVFERIFLDDEI